jgi:hypothetical protein
MAGHATTPPTSCHPKMKESNILNFTDEGDTPSGPLPVALPAAGVTSTLKTQ